MTPPPINADSKSSSLNDFVSKVVSQILNSHDMFYNVHRSNVGKVFSYICINRYSTMDIRIIPTQVRPLVMVLAQLSLYWFLSIITFSCFYLFMDELHQAVAPFLHGARGAGMDGMGGNFSGGSGGGGSNWFDLGVLPQEST
ncbi:hypothetical protein V6N11_018108 [Hibiscus sabdariffa]|uniref:Uncharacterized protein n=1 Tax=Hibiscus sabdariffa TaxID=183260 RepID=A0ABR2T6F3_9ROSI